MQRETVACFNVLCRIVNVACCWFLSDDKDAALLEALRRYGGTGQRVLVFVAMKKHCDVGAPDIYPLSNGKPVSDSVSVSRVAKMIMRMLRKYGIPANTMHSDKALIFELRPTWSLDSFYMLLSKELCLVMTFVRSHEDQQQREEALQQFKSGETRDAQDDAHRA